MALHKLSRFGLRLRGEPMGLSMSAQALLNEHTWPGNEAELDAVLLRAALATAGAVVDREQLEQAMGALDEGPGRSGMPTAAGSHERAAGS